MSFFNEIQYLTPYISGNMYRRLIIQTDSNRSHPKLLFSKWKLYIKPSYFELLGLKVDQNTILPKTENSYFNKNQRLKNLYEQKNSVWLN